MKTAKSAKSAKSNFCTLGANGCRNPMCLENRAFISAHIWPRHLIYIPSRRSCSLYTAIPPYPNLGAIRGSDRVLYMFPPSPSPPPCVLLALCALYCFIGLNGGRGELFPAPSPPRHFLPTTGACQCGLTLVKAATSFDGCWIGEYVTAVNKKWLYLKQFSRLLSCVIFQDKESESEDFFFRIIKLLPTHTHTQHTYDEPIPS